MAIINVSNATQLNAAVAAAKGGDTIRLAAGSYGNVAITSIKPSSAVIIKSADAANPAHFDTLAVRSSQNLTFKGLDIGRGLLDGEPDHTQLSFVRNSSTIVFDGNHIHGSMDNNAQNDGYGLLVDTVAGLSLINNTFEQLTRGAVVSRITNMYVGYNKFLEIRSDGLDTDGSKHILIEHNLFNGFYPLDYDHPDAMQFHNLGSATPMENVTIRNNMLLAGGDYSPQGVWISDPGTTGFRNFTIENNLLFGEGSYNGIGINGLIGGKVIGNTVMSPTGDAKVMWIRVLDGSNIDLINNVSEDIIVSPTATNVRVIDSVNLKTTPALRAQMGNAEDPTGWADIRLPGYGAVAPGPVTHDAPVSGAVSSALSGMLASSIGQSFSQTVAVNDDKATDQIALPAIDSAATQALSHLAQIFSQAPAAPDLFPSAPFDAFAPEPSHVPVGWRFSFHDSFVALP